ncbi:hypothetical protein MUK42_13426 [Musa troglodytarum]|uniref:Uncharacterized protein n=1 Tax=Musa troglodytarum TaxID=320322 RepID=A0A9E7GZE8_9LILI|nr:hypothetical protein MUK42_13426 [Musa troglodytarum]
MQEYDARMQERGAELMEQVRSMFKDTTDILQTLDSVDSIQLLGLSYRFEKETNEALNRVHDADFNDHGLYDTALRFRLLRQQWYHVTPECATRKDALLELAKLDFNLLQCLHGDEIKSISIWWNDLLSKNLSFARDRMVECYYWILAVYFEPHYSHAQVITTKVAAMTSILDDIYDLCSTLEESQLLTQAIQRWDAKAVHQLLEYMKGYFLKLIHAFEEFKNLLAHNEKYRVFYLKEAGIF